MSLYDAGGGAYQTLLKRVAAPGYPTRPDIAVHAVTIQVPLEGSLLTGGVAFVLKTGQQQWLACRAEGVLRSDFFISTQQVCSITLSYLCARESISNTYRQPQSCPSRKVCGEHHCSICNVFTMQE